MDAKEIREQADIEEVCNSLGMEITQMGTAYLVKCPCHEDNHPSAFFKKGDNYIYCNVCRKNINAIDLIMAEQGIAFKDALDELATIEGVSLDKGKKRFDDNRVKPSEAGFLGVKSGYADFLGEKEYRELLKAHLLMRKKKLQDIESFLGISLADENKQLLAIEKKIGG